jgi:hypothetical protein
VPVEGLRRAHGICQLPAIHQKNIEQSVVVVVEERNTAAHGFDQVLLRRGGIDVVEIQAARMLHVK